MSRFCIGSQFFSNWSVLDSAIADVACVCNERIRTYYFRKEVCSACFAMSAHCRACCILYILKHRALLGDLRVTSHYTFDV